MSNYIKSRNNAPKGFFEAEFIGLEWLGEAGKSDINAVKIAKPYKYSENSLEMEKINTTSQTVAAAYKFGEGLARMHYSELFNEKSDKSVQSSHCFGYSPSSPNFFGPLSDPIEMPTNEFHTFWEYFINGRMKPILDICYKRNQMDKDDIQKSLIKLEKLRNDWSFLDNQDMFMPAKVHGDLWSGNLLWQISPETEQTEAVLIDPSAHIGLGLEDLAMLNLFGCGYYSQILEGYFTTIFKNGFTPEKPDSFNSIIKMLNLFPIAGHIAFFGSAYHSQYWSMLNSL